jgi:hypothetical protein
MNRQKARSRVVQCIRVSVDTDLDQPILPMMS